MALGEPTIRIRTRQGTALVWLLRASDTVFVAASIPDSTPYWGDDFVDFQVYFRRVLDSSVVYRGRNGRWQPPWGDPDWRLGSDRDGGGWEVSARDCAQGWSILVRLDPAWFAGEGGHRARIAFRIYDDSPSGWYPWPSPQGSAPTMVERAPYEWAHRHLRTPITGSR